VVSAEDMGNEARRFSCLLLGQAVEGPGGWAPKLTVVGMRQHNRRNSEERGEVGRVRIQSQAQVGLFHDTSYTPTDFRCTRSGPAEQFDSAARNARGNGSTHVARERIALSIQPSIDDHPKVQRLRNSLRALPEQVGPLMGRSQYRL